MSEVDISLKEQQGFTLIELLIVIAVISIMAAIAIPGYLGMQERVRKMVAISSAASSESELQAWLSSALKSSNPAQSTLIEVDSQGDGVIDSLDVNNAQLGLWLRNGSGDLDSAYVSARRAQYKEKSPWFPSIDLWANDVASSGQITVSGISTFPFFLRLEARDRMGATLYIKTIYAD